MDEISKTFNVLVDAHFSSSLVSGSRFHDFGKCDRTEQDMPDVWFFFLIASIIYLFLLLYFIIFLLILLPLYFNFFPYLSFSPCLCLSFSLSPSFSLFYSSLFSIYFS